MAKLLHNLIKGFRKSKFHYRGICNICGHRTIFFGYNMLSYTHLKYRNDLKCVYCGSNARQRAIAAVINEIYSNACDTFIKLKSVLFRDHRRIHNTSSREVIHKMLCSLPDYTCSEYFPDVPSGRMYKGVRCEDMQNLSFSDGELDLFISEDVLEHVRRPDRAFASIHRVLKAGGYHVFTVPVHGEKTLVRVDVSGHEDRFIMPAVYHSDPLNSKGALAYNDFGEDIIVYADNHGFKSKLLKFNMEDHNYKCGHVIVSQKH